MVHADGNVWKDFHGLREGQLLWRLQAPGKVCSVSSGEVFFHQYRPSLPAVRYSCHYPSFRWANIGPPLSGSNSLHSIILSVFSEYSAKLGVRGEGGFFKSPS